MFASVDDCITGDVASYGLPCGVSVLLADDPSVDSTGEYELMVSQGSETSGPMMFLRPKESVTRPLFTVP